MYCSLSGKVDQLTFPDNEQYTHGQLLSTFSIGQREAMSSQLINLSRQQTIHTQGQLQSTLTIGQRVVS